MTNTTIEREILIDAPVGIVWATITESDQIGQWFADRVELDLRPGGEGRLTFDNNATAQAVTAAIVVEQADEPRLFSFRWGHPAGDQPVKSNSVLVEFTLSAEAEDRTRLRVAETGLDELDWSDEQKASYAEDHRHGWEIHLGRLHDLLGR